MNIVVPSEREFQDAVADVARLAGWRVVHFRPARTAEGWRTPGAYDAHGWPDLTLVRPPRLLFAELKSPTGTLSRRQHEWLDVLRLLPAVEVYLWRPADWHELVGVLTGQELAA